MGYFKNILVALDFVSSEQAEIDHALTLAEIHQSKVTLISVIPELAADAHLEISAMSPQERMELQLSKREQKLEGVASCLKAKGISVSYLATCGAPCLEIIKQVIREDHDLLVISERETHGLKKRLIGSTAMQLLRKCPCPIWAVNPEHPEHYNRTMATIDVRKDDQTNDNISLNNTILTMAGTLANADHSELHLLNILPSEDARSEHLGKIKTLLSDNELELPDERIYLKTGDVTAVIPASAEENNIDLLVMGMLSRTGIVGFFIGNTAEKIISSVNCSVLVIKPKEFVSPVTLDD
jgi:nucleotide-binding universal stress UspA family protein